VEALANDYRLADLSERDLAMLVYADKLTGDPCTMASDDCDALKQAGFKDDEVLDIVQVTAYFNFVNRLACGLGVDLEPYWQPSTP
jgi:uncharacterized peroxidase-related enzyme